MGNKAKQELRPNENDLKTRVEKANTEIKKILGKYELGLAANPQLSNLQGTQGFVVVAQVQFVSTRGQAVNSALEGNA